MPEAHTDPAHARDVTLDSGPCGENGYPIAARRRNQNRLNRAALFGAVGGNRLRQANPKFLPRRENAAGFVLRVAAGATKYAAERQKQNSLCKPNAPSMALKGARNTQL